MHFYISFGGSLIGTYVFYSIVGTRGDRNLHNCICGSKSGCTVKKICVAPVNKEHNIEFVFVAVQIDFDFVCVSIP